MKNKHILFQLLFLLSVMGFSLITSTLVYAHTGISELQVISPQNVESLQYLTRIGQGIFSGAFDLQPDGDLIAAVSKSGVALLNRNTGEQERFIAVEYNITALTISPDGQTLAVVYNVPTGKMTDITGNGLYGPDYQRQISFYSLADGEPQGRVIKDLQECSGSNIWQIAYLPDGENLVFEKKYGGKNDQNQFCVLSTTTGKITQTLDIPDDANSTLSPDGRYAAVIQFDDEYQTDKASIYDAETFKSIAEIAFPLASGPEIAFSNTGEIFTVGYYEGDSEETPYQVSFWSLPEGKLIQTIQEQETVKSTFETYGSQQTEQYDRIMSVDISSDGRYAVTGSQNGRVKLWDLKTGKLAEDLGTLTWTCTSQVMNRGGANSSEMTSYVKPVMFSSDGDSLVAAAYLTTYGQSGQMHVYQVPDGKETAVFYGSKVGDTDIGLGFSPDSSKIAFGGFKDGSAEVHNIPDGALDLTLIGHTAPVNKAQYSPDGKWIATASDDNTVRVWDSHSGKTVHVLKGHAARVTQIAFSPESSWLVSGADDNTLKRWDVEDGSLLDTRFLGDENWRFELLAVLPDEQSVVYKTLKYPSPMTGYITEQVLWDVESGKATPIGGGRISITSLGEDGTTFVGVYNDGNGYIVGTLETSGKMTLTADKIRSPYGNGAITSPAVSPDNRLIFTGNGFGLHAWEITGASASFIDLLAGTEPIPAYGNLYKVSPDGKILAFADGGVVYLMGVPEK